MKKTALIIIGLVVISLSTLQAQDHLVNKGDKVVNLGIGLGNNLTGDGRIPPISLSFEMGLKENVLEGTVDNINLGVGGYLGYTGTNFQGFGYEINYNYLIIGARGYAHYPLVDKLDTYLGLMLGINIASTSVVSGTLPQGFNNNVGGFGYSFFIGGRYFLTDNIAGMLELGYGISFLNIGIAAKF